MDASVKFLRLVVGDAERFPASRVDGRVCEILADREPEPHEATAPTDTWNPPDGARGTQHILSYSPEELRVPPVRQGENQSHR